MKVMELTEKRLAEVTKKLITSISFCKKSGMSHGELNHLKDAAKAKLDTAREDDKPYLQGIIDTVDFIQEEYAEDDLRDLFTEHLENWEDQESQAWKQDATTDFIVSMSHNVF